MWNSNWIKMRRVCCLGHFAHEVWQFSPLSGISGSFVARLNSLCFRISEAAGVVELFSLLKPNSGTARKFPTVSDDIEKIKVRSKLCIKNHK